LSRTAQTRADTYIVNRGIRTRSVSRRQMGILCAIVATVSLASVMPVRADRGGPKRCHGVHVAPGDNIQTLLDTKPPGTTFCFAKGIYRLARTILTEDRFPTLDLRAGAVIDGQNGEFTGITSQDPPTGEPGMKILGGVFQHFGNASAPMWVGPFVLRDNGVVEGTEFRENFNTGLEVQGDNARVTDVYTHHNGRYGLVLNGSCQGCSGPKGVIIQDSEIAFNNTRHLATDGDAGGTKFSGGTNGMIVRRNEVHDNYGSGLWWDGYNKNAQVYGNRIYGNRNWGIMWELSYGGAKIHDNTLIGNGIGDGTPNFFNGVQLLISCSDGSIGGIEVYGNTIKGSAYPLGLINHSGHPIRTRQVFVHDNVMTLRSPDTRVGAEAADGLIELFSAAAHNRFEANIYRVPNPSGAYWAWDGQVLTWRQWRALGHDQNGAVQAIP
jgi:Right handed beta helix region